MIHEDKNKKYKEKIMKNVIFSVLSQNDVFMTSLQFSMR